MISIEIFFCESSNRNTLIAQELFFCKFQMEIYPDIYFLYMFFLLLHMDELKKIIRKLNFDSCWHSESWLEFPISRFSSMFC